ncbi:serine hydrolase domain-containing protein [Nocardia sp. GCM10030253]|uniref:serine hydrolase domain-containing protein n=1 Tax=Nocardia sp. GCM10030253 TaxID=3273404 RepID=UPI00363E4453
MPFEMSEVERAADAMITGGAVAVTVDVRAGGTHVTIARGLRDLDSRLPAVSDSPTRIASVSKMMVSAVVLKLVEQRKFMLDAPAVESLPEQAEVLGSATIRQLLDHTGGVPNPLRQLLAGKSAPEQIALAQKPYTDEDWLALTRAMPRSEGFDYSNTNYLLLAMIAQRVTDTALPELLRQYVFAPVGMTSTSVPTEDRLSPESLMPYVFDGDNPVPAPVQSPSYWGPGGWVVSTPADLSAFARALFSGQLFTESLLTEMMTPGPSGSYGLGIFARADVCGKPEPIWGNRGNGLGAKSYLFASPDGNRVVALTWTGADIDIPNDRLNTEVNDLLNAGLAATCPH